MVPTYNKFCELIGDDEIAHRFLTGWQPPAYITGCSQLVTLKQPQLVRNYDYHPHLSEGTVINTAWHGKYVMGIGDCLIGIVDGMNSDGLVASLTFGGRKVVGEGFGVPFILRYILEFSSTISEAIKRLSEIPTHMAYNIMLLNEEGEYKMIQISPDNKPVITDYRMSTNHQGTPDWPEHAQFSKTIEREDFLKKIITEGREEPHNEEVIQKFLAKPLFNRQYQDGFGTISTSVYRPSLGEMELRWEGDKLQQSFGNFNEGSILITYNDKESKSTQKEESAVIINQTTDQTEVADYWVNYGKQWATGDLTQLAYQVVQSIVSSMPHAHREEVEKLVSVFRSETKRRGEVPWEMLADFWSGYNHTKHHSTLK